MSCSTMRFLNLILSSIIFVVAVESSYRIASQDTR